MVSARGGRLTQRFLCVMLLVLGAGCATAPPGPPSREQVLQRILPATVQVSLEQDGRRFRSGSGVVVAARPAGQDSECFVMTSGHTLAGFGDPQQVFVLFDRHLGKKTKVRARMVARRESAELDLALLQVRAPQCLAAELGQPPGLGDAVWVVAFPWGREMTLVAGVVSQLNPDTPDESGSHLMVDASVSYGASGGGVFDATTGRLIGLVEGYHTARVSFKGDSTGRYIDVPVPGETYVAPLADIRRFLRESGYAGLLGEPAAIAKPRP
jgi:serine protease Do